MYLINFLRTSMFRNISTESITVIGRIGLEQFVIDVFNVQFFIPEKYFVFMSHFVTDFVDNRLMLHYKKIKSYQNLFGTIFLR